MSETVVEKVTERIQNNNKVLFVWSGKNVPETIQTAIERIQSKVGTDEKVHVEHVDRLSVANYSSSSFDAILANILTPEDDIITVSLISTFLKLLKPKGSLIASVKDGLESNLKLNGFTNVNQEANGALLIAEKPNFEVGSSTKLKFASKTNGTAPEPAKKVWTFAQDDLAEDDLIDTDDLLDDLDLKKPTPSESKFDCGTDKAGKKKACKNCSCGLAEEIENEAQDTQKNNAATVKSACGSCYLGDAFRCASCPYLGMPAFKPGEKVQLANTQPDA